MVLVRISRLVSSRVSDRGHVKRPEKFRSDKSKKTQIYVFLEMLLWEEGVFDSMTFTPT